MLKNTEKTYGSVSKTFHWVIFVLVTLMLSCGFFMDDFPDSIQGTTYMLHKSTGLLIWSLMVFRVIWRWMNPVPGYPDTMPKFQQKLAHFVHWILYIVLLAMPLDGWIMSTAANRIPSFFGLISLPFPGIEPSEQLANQLADLHGVLAYVLLTLVIGHIIAAIKHHLVDKDDILTRMMPK